MAGNTKAAKNISASSDSIINLLLTGKMKNKIDPFIYQSFKTFMDMHHFKNIDADVLKINIWWLKM